MKKSQTFSLILLASSALLASNAFAQTSPTSGSAQTPAAKPQSSTGTTAAKPQSSTAAKKPGTATTAKPGATAPLVLKTNREKASYAFGVNLAKNMKQQGVDLDPTVLARGFKDGFSGAKPLLSDQEAQSALLAYSEEVKKKMEAQQAAVGAVNQKEGEAFLAANKTKPGVVVLPSGLQYKILTPGNGPKPTAADTIVCNYKGTLINGTEFDASAKHGGPATIPVGGVIKGWTEALQLMPVGSKWELYVPADLAYGSRAAGPDIGPNATLIFEVELVSIQEKPKEAPADPAKPAAPTAPPQTPQPQAAPQATPPPAPQPTPKPPSL
ncbi:MAG TPA: FKBP-type peptidyl-prolyl cis-trans isomerase N-terminal domain-containing protein [Candidatus Dormibacteraeota bacterium]|jgi:FKBP-type peptidyl-prolyl cis-trans isomerase FklB|nr:FKBP-type peptidyl-prolyl cis-trans isomerase N-terminal domain-containing protein [Candidatus Dormibacteraeota bacterium]